MNSKPAKPQSTSSAHSDVGVYDCEIRLKFRVIEDKQVLSDRDQCLETLLDAFSYGADGYMEPIQVEVEVQELPEIEASPQMRRQLIRLRNSSDIA